MGLDITAYRGLKLVDRYEVDDKGYPTDWTLFRVGQILLDYTEKNFPGRTRGLVAGVYQPAEVYEFRAGSYSGYGLWRNQLAIFAGYGSAEHVWQWNGK